MTVRSTRAALLLLLLGCATTVDFKEGLQPLHDGRTLLGWHPSGKTGHGTGGRWVVKDGAIVGSQDRPGNGGILITDREYGDFYVQLEMKNDYGPDSGLFLRSTEDGKAYQAMIDYHDNGNLMGLYGEGIGGDLGARNFTLGPSPDRVEVQEHAFPFPWTPASWKAEWKHGEWNRLAARIRGNPPVIETWINGKKVMEWKDTKRRLPDRGGIALQVHGGGDWTEHFVRYRNIMVREE